MTPTERRASSSLAALFGLRLLGLFLMLPVFALSLVMGPLRAKKIGFGGLFALTGLLALAGVLAVAFWVPPEPPRESPPVGQAGSVVAVLKNPALLRLDVGVFVLHAVQLAMWVAIPALLVTAGLDKGQHWQIFLPVAVVSFLVMWVTLFPLKKGAI